MVPVKIECECGQNYAFDVEPVNGRMPGGVTCPSCGADGTAAANEYISRQLAPYAAAAVPSPQPVRRASAQPATMAEGSRRGLVDLDKAEKEARTKIMWGDPVEQVAAYLTVQGLDRNEARELANRLFQERAAIVRSNGIKKIIVGIVLACVPVLAYFLFHAAGRFPIKLSVICYGIGIFGVYMIITGIMAVVSTKSERGAVTKE